MGLLDTGILYAKYRGINFLTFALISKPRPIEIYNMWMAFIIRKSQNCNTNININK